MGLALEVGALASRLEDGSGGAAYLETELAALSVALRAAGLAEHREPRALAPEQRWSSDMFGYSGLHYLRRIGAHLAYGRPLPSPGDDKSSEDSLLEAYFADVERDDEGDAGWLSRIVRRPRPRRDFDHLILHSDAEGFYVPRDFARVIFPDPELEVPGGMVGSSTALLRECDRLAAALGIPTDLGPDDEELLEAAEAQGDGEGWLRFGIESFTCVTLREAARRSVQTGSVILFT